MGNTNQLYLVKTMCVVLNHSFFFSHTAVIHLTHNLSPTILPSFINLQVPAITTLHFRETECDSGLLKIFKQEDSWTLEGKLVKIWFITITHQISLGLLQSVPLISFWYNHVLRVVMGKLMTTTGDILDSAVNHAQKMSMQSREIQQIGHELAIENLEKLDEYRSDLKINYLQGIESWKECYPNEEEEDDMDYAPLTPIKESRLLTEREQDYYL